MVEHGPYYHAKPDRVATRNFVRGDTASARPTRNYTRDEETGTLAPSYAGYKWDGPTCLCHRHESAKSSCQHRQYGKPSHQPCSNSVRHHLAQANSRDQDIEDLFREDEQATLALAAEAQASLLRTTSGSSAAPSLPAHVDHPPFPKPLSRIRNTSGEGSPDQPYPRSLTYTSPYSVSRPETADSSAPAYFDVFSDIQDTCGPGFPSFFFTKFDEQNPLPGFGGEDHAMSGVEFQAQRVPSVVSMLGAEAQQ